MRLSSLSKLAASLALAALVTTTAPAFADTPQEILDRASAAVSRGDYALAEKELGAVKGGKERAEALHRLARVQLTMGRYADALTTAKTLAGLGRDAKNNAAAIKGEALAAQGKTADAITALKEVENEDGARRARLLLGELYIRTGKRGDARAPLMTLIQDYNDDKITASDPEGLAMVGRAAHLLRSPRDANEAFNAAEKAGANKRPEALLWYAELLLEKYNPGRAGQLVKEALKIAPRDPRTRVAMARVRLDNAMDFAAAQSEIKQALEVNPTLPSAFFVRAGLAARDMDLTAADAAVDQGLKTDPTDLELLSMRAAIRFLADDKAGFEAAKKQVLGLNPEYSNFYQIVGEYAEWEHRYEDIVKMMREAVTVDKNDAKAYASMGLNLIRSGDDDGGMDALKKAWEKDKYNVRVFNTLNLFEKNIATEYVTVAGQTFKMRYHKDEREILERYVPRMLEEAWGSMVRRYGFTPKTPVAIELYADTDHFSVRTSGLPNVGIQGVCFGQTLAALSPGAAPFNWGNVIWHELGHVFALQLSKNHVPRWFTEGLSEYETIIRRPEWQREEDPALYAALKAGRIPAVLGFNKAFTHVDSIEEVTMAYYAASQIVVFMAEKFGFPKLASMLGRWGNGERTGDIIKATLGISSEELDKQYRAWLKPRLARYDQQYVPDLHAPPLDDARKAVKADPQNPKKQVELSLALLADGQAPEAEAVLDEALRLDPNQPDALYILLKKALRQKKLDEAERLIQKLIAGKHDGYALRLKAADIAEAKKQWGQAKEHLEAAHKLDPIQAEPLQGLYDLAHKQKDDAGELWALERLARIDQHSRKVYNMLLERLLKKGEWEKARQVGESAMFVDVRNPKTHRMYARALARTGNFISAIYELNSALVCKPKPADQIEIYEELVKAYDKLGEKEHAKQAGEYLKQIKGAPTMGPTPKDDKGKRPDPTDDET